jgi:hypothetical protein
MALQHHGTHRGVPGRACASASAIAAYMATVIEFFLSTRFSVIVITPASVWVRMSVMVGVAHDKASLTFGKIAHDPPVLAPEHLVADKKRGGAEDAALHRRLGALGLEGVLDAGSLAIASSACRDRSQPRAARGPRCRVVHVERPTQMARNIARSSPPSAGSRQLQAGGAAHQQQGVDRKRRVHGERHAITPRETREVGEQIYCPLAGMVAGEWLPVA